MDLEALNRHHARLVAERDKTYPFEDVSILASKLALLDCYFTITVTCADGATRIIEREMPVET